MIELIRTNDPVLISWLRALLAGENIEAFILDMHTSVLEGSANAIPRRVMVAEEHFNIAKQLLDASRAQYDSAPAFE